MQTQPAVEGRGCLPWTVGGFLQVEAFQVDPPFDEAPAHNIQGLGGGG